MVIPCLLPLGSRAEEPSWVFRSAADIRWHGTAPGVLIVGTDADVRAFSQEDGTEQWRLDVPGLESHQLDPLPYLTLAVVSHPAGTRRSYPMVTLVDLMSGEELWTSLQNNLATSYGTFLVPHRNGLLVYGKEIGGTERVLMLLDLETGVPRWSVERPFAGWEPAIFGEGAQPPVFDGPDSMILFLNGRSIRKYHLADGRLVWEAQDLSYGKLDTNPEEIAGGSHPAPTLADGYAPMTLSRDGRLFFAPHHDTVGAFSTFNGSRRWLNPIRLDGYATQMEMVEQGLLVRSIPVDPEESRLHWIRLIDGRNGRELWRSPRREGSIVSKVLGTWLDSTPFLLHEGRVLIAADGKLFSIELESGQERKLCDVDFRGVDTAVSLELRGEELLVVGDQNALWCDLDGQPLRRVHYEPPDGIMTGLRKLLTAAIANATDEIRIGQVTIRGEHDYEAGLADLLRDYTATLEGAEYFYMLTDSGGGPQIVRVAKDGGEERGRIAVGTVEPEYRICPYSGNLLWKSDERTLACFSFR